MNRLIGTLLAASILCLFRVPVHAVPAFPGEISYTQPDGTVVKYHLRGDEHRHWMESAEGYILEKAENGYLMYAEKKGGALKASALKYTGDDNTAKARMRLLTRADMPAPARTVGDPSLSIGQSFPLTGKRKLLMLLVNFADTKTTVEAAAFDEMMNAEGYDGTGSFRDFYLENSYGQLDIETTVIGWIQLPSNKAMYDTEDMTQLISDAITAVGNTVDFSQFDNDGDGILDGLSIIHQGTGQEVTGSPGDIWSHSAELLADVYAGGKRVRTYTIQPELLGYPTATQMATVGVFCHEFGHNLGAPDFYDTDYEGSGGNFNGTGVWDLMAEGIWNEDLVPGDSPSHINMWQKMQFGWVKPEYLTESRTVNDIPAASDEPVGYIAETTREGDYFVIEHRVPQKFDRLLPGSGLVVYHVDENRLRQTLNMNTINADYAQAVYTVCASATGDPGTSPASYGDINSAGALFPGTGGAAEFSDTTTPSTHSNDGKYAYFSLRDIKADGAVASFSFVKEEAPQTVRNFTAAARRGVVTLTWDAPEKGTVEAYRVFRDNVLIEETTGLQYVDNNLTATVATYKVDVLYADGLYSPFATSTVRVPANKIESVTPQVEGQEVTLTWELDDMLTRMNPDIGTAMDNVLITSVSGGTMEFAQLFTAAELKTYAGYVIEELSFCPFSSQREVSYKLRVYRAEPGGTPEVASERNVTEYGSGAWRTLKLPTPVEIEPGYDYYIGFAAESSIGYVAVVCDGTTLDEGKGNLACVDGEWSGNMLEGNIFLYATLQPHTPGAADFVKGEQPEFNPDFDPVADTAYPLGFNVYRDNELVGFTSTGIFIDEAAGTGRHVYSISCLYEGDNESRPAETTVNVTSTGIDGVADGGEAGTVSADGRTIRARSACGGTLSVFTPGGTAIATGVEIAAGGEAAVNPGAPGLYIAVLKSQNKVSTYKITIK